MSFLIYVRPLICETARFLLYNLNDLAMTESRSKIESEAGESNSLAILGYF